MPVTVYEMSNEQWFLRYQEVVRFWFWTRRLWFPWRVPPVTPLPASRAVDDDPVDPTLIGEAPELPEWLQGAGGYVGLPRPYQPRERLTAGTPYQVGNSALGRALTTWLNTAYGKNEPVSFPWPVDHRGDLWVEGNPTPSFALVGNGTIHDAHVMVYDQFDGTYYEAIGYNVLLNTVSGWGHWASDGTLLEGTSTNVAKRCMGRSIWATGDRPHMLNLVVRGDDNAEPTWPWYQRRVVLSPDAHTPEFDPHTPEGRFVESLRTYGAIIGDHGGGSGFRYVAGDPGLESLDWQGWNLHLSDLLPADGLSGP